MTETGFGQILRQLADFEVQFVLIGGLAAIVHGSSRATFDVDVVYDRSAKNLQSIIESLQPFEPYLRGVPKGLPFLWDVQTLQAGLNFTLTTTLGDLDLLGEVAGGGTYDSLISHSKNISIFKCSCRCVTLSKLIELKQAAGRPKDLEAIAELLTIQENQN